MNSHLYKVGEIKKAQELGRDGTYRYIFIPCVDCKECRWVRLNTGVLVTQRCLPCSCREMTKLRIQQGSTHPMLGKYHSPETRYKISIAHRGRSNPISEETKAKIREARLGHSVSEGTRAKLRKFHTGRHHTKETKELLRQQSSQRQHSEATKQALRELMNSQRMKAILSAKSKALWKELEYKTKVVKNSCKALCIKPNKCELQLLGILDKRFPNQWKYTGQGDMIIGGKCPDFTNVDGLKAVIELFGVYWHKERVRCYEETEDGRIVHFNKYGFSCLVIWEDELRYPEQVTEKISNFIQEQR